MCNSNQQFMSAFLKPYAEGARLAQSAKQQNAGGSSMPQPTGGVPAYGDMQQQPQDLQASAPKPTASRFSFNNGNFRIADSSMNSSDSGLNV